MFRLSNQCYMNLIKNPQERGSNLRPGVYASFQKLSKKGEKPIWKNVFVGSTVSLLSENYCHYPLNNLVNKTNFCL